MHELSRKAFTTIFGIYGDERHREPWLRWLDDQGDDGTDGAGAFYELVARGCDKDSLLSLLMELHRSLSLRPVSRKELAEAAKALRVASRAIGRLTNSQLVYELGLAEPNPESHQRGWRLSYELWDIETKCTQAKPVSKHENPARNRILASLVRLTKKATGQFHDELLARNVALLWRESFDMEVWRKRHRSFWERPAKT
jgi:hypothetical protein